MKQTGQPLRFNEQEYAESDEDLSLAWDDSDEPLDKYGEKVQQLRMNRKRRPSAQAVMNYAACWNGSDKWHFLHASIPRR